ncbi:MAG: 2-dehydro-3-deoxy-6-phosphogalactonate aldolase [Limnohabitans sp.]
MNAEATAVLQQAMGRCPLVAILRGLTPPEAVGVGQALVGQGFVLLEVPLNSPDPLQSIATLAERYPEALVGAGTVTTPRQVAQVRAAGGRLIVSPHWDRAVVDAAVQSAMVCVPGVATPTEAFAAWQAGAHALKLFPAELITPPVVKALRAVLPSHLPLLPVGSITPDNMAAYLKAGADGFGIGSALYAPGRSADQVGERAMRLVTAWRSCAGHGSITA